MIFKEYEKPVMIKDIKKEKENITLQLELYNFEEFQEF